MLNPGNLAVMVLQFLVILAQGAPRDLSALTGWYHNQTREPPIPFYLYPFEQFPLSWGSGSGCRHDVSRTPKHDHGDFAWRAMVRHPWRTNDPLQAKVGVLPIPFDLHARGGCLPRVSIDELLAEMKSVLDKSSIFPGVRHMVIMNDFKTSSHRARVMAALAPVGIVVGMEGRGKCLTSLGYTSNYAEYTSLRAPNGVYMPTLALPPNKRTFSVHSVFQVDNRRGYADRRALMRAKGTLSDTFIVGLTHTNMEGARACRSAKDHARCVRNTSMPRQETQWASERSNYTLCLRGDTLGSDRWLNGMAAGTALIYVIDNDADFDWLPFPKAVPWRNIVLAIQRSTFQRDPISAIKSVTSISAERLETLQRLSLHHAADLDWNAYHSRTLVNLLREVLEVPC